MRLLTLIVALLTLSGVATAYAQATKEDCSALQAALLSISVDMKALQNTVKTGTEQSWIGSLSGAERQAIVGVRDARLGLVAALDDYVAATQDAAVAMTSCAR